MASHFLQLNDKISQGEGAPVDGDALSTSLSLFPVGAIYIDNNTGTVYARNTATGAAADWVNSAGGGSTPGIDDVLAVGQELTDIRQITITGQKLLINGNNCSLVIDDLTGEVNIGVGRLQIQNGQILMSLAPFADNAAALSGGVPNGGLYYTDVAGEFIIKQAHD
jgi:hypothetical protein